MPVFFYRFTPFLHLRVVPFRIHFLAFVVTHPACLQEIIIRLFRLLDHRIHRFHVIPQRFHTERLVVIDPGDDRLPFSNRQVALVALIPQSQPCCAFRCVNAFPFTDLLQRHV